MTDDINSLERDIEAARERLAETIDQLVSRTNPRNIVDREVSNARAFFVDPVTGAPQTENILKVVGGVVGTIMLIRLVRKVVS